MTSTRPVYIELFQIPRHNRPGFKWVVYPLFGRHKHQRTVQKIANRGFPVQLNVNYRAIKLLILKLMLQKESESLHVKFTDDQPIRKLKIYL